MQSNSLRSHNSKDSAAPQHSRYPRKGHCLAPSILHDVLDVPAKRLSVEIVVRLCDLDESVWDRFSPSVCRQLARAIVDRVSVVVWRKNTEVLNRRLPPLPFGKELVDLPLEVRTYNCLVGLGGLDLRGKKLEEYTISDLLSLRGFGAKSLVDLLTSIESVGARSGNVIEQYSSLDARDIRRSEIEPYLLDELKTKIKKLNSIKYINSILSTDVRLGNQILKIDSEAQNIRELSGRLVKKEYHSSSEIEKNIKAIERLQRQLSNITELSLKEELEGIVRAVGSMGDEHRNAQIYMRYFGWDGQGGAVLEEVGGMFGLTRERVRQICSKLNRSFKSQRPSVFAPMLDK